MNGSEDYIIRVSIAPPYSEESKVYCYAVSPIEGKDLEPIAETDCGSVVAMVTGEAMPDAARRKRAKRSVLVKRIAKNITRGILKALEEQDTMNGHPKCPLIQPGSI